MDEGSSDEEHGGSDSESPIIVQDSMKDASSHIDAHCTGTKEKCCW